MTAGRAVAVSDLASLDLVNWLTSDSICFLQAELVDMKITELTKELA